MYFLFIKKSVAASPLKMLENHQSLLPSIEQEALINKKCVITFSVR